MDLQWENIFSQNREEISFATARAPVPNGWLINHTIRFRQSVATSTCFIEDPEHEWDIEGGSSDAI